MTQVDVDVLFDEGDVLVVDKPAGLAMHGEPDALDRAIADNWGAPPSFLGRLDRGTSGLVVAALTPDALRALQPAWTSGAVVKEYLVVVHGKAKERGRVEIPLAARGKRKKGSGAVEPALTTFRRVHVDAAGRTSVLVATLHTGRTHQIRRHMKAVGHPVVGDERYGHPARDRDLGAAPGLMLHAWRLGHDGSVGLLPRRLEAPVPSRMRPLLGGTAPV